MKDLMLFFAIERIAAVNYLSQTTKKKPQKYELKAEREREREHRVSSELHNTEHNSLCSLI